MDVDTEVVNPRRAAEGNLSRRQARALSLAEVEQRPDPVRDDLGAVEVGIPDVDLNGAPGHGQDRIPRSEVGEGHRWLEQDRDMTQPISNPARSGAGAGRGAGHGAGVTVEELGQP